MKNRLEELGYRLREREVRADRRERPGHITFDDRGNAVYEWNDEQLRDDGEEAERLRMKALAYPGLTLVDEDPDPSVPIRPNPKGLRVGYNPYESGMLEKKEWKRKKDLRELSRWIETKRRLECSDKGDDT